MKVMAIYLNSSLINKSSLEHSLAVNKALVDKMINGDTRQAIEEHPEILVNEEPLEEIEVEECPASKKSWGLSERFVKPEIPSFFRKDDNWLYLPVRILWV